MANGAEPVGGAPLTHTLYIWPTPELIGQSSRWPAPWLGAFAVAAGELGRLVATCVLGGLRVSQAPVTLRLPSGCIGFSITVWDTSIYIAVSAFEGPQHPGPDAPGPNGGLRRRPRSADGLVLGLRGSGRSFTIVTFYGPQPPTPAGRTIERVPKSAKGLIAGSRSSGSHSDRDLVAARQAGLPTRFRTAHLNKIYRRYDPGDQLFFRLAAKNASIAACGSPVV